MRLFQGRFARFAARSVTAAAVSLGVLGAVTSAQASVVFDFVGIVAAVGEQPFNNDPTGYATQGGITIQATASGFPGAQAYLDAVSGGNPAGLGACHGFTGDSPPQCTPSSEDNVTFGETLTLSFFSDMALANPLTVVLNPTFFRNAQHGTMFTGDFDIQVDGMGFNTFALINNFTTDLGPGSVFDFMYNDDEFYISSITVNPVPLPAALPLFLSALAGLVLLGRRQRKKAAA